MKETMKLNLESLAVQSFIVNVKSKDEQDKMKGGWNQHSLLDIHCATQGC